MLNSMLQFVFNYGYLFHLVAIVAIALGLRFGQTVYTHPRADLYIVPLNLLALFLLGYGTWNSSAVCIVSAVLLLCFEMCMMGTGEGKSHWDSGAARKTLVHDGLFVAVTPFALLALAAFSCTTLF